VKNNVYWAYNFPFGSIEAFKVLVALATSHDVLSRDGRKDLYERNAVVHLYELPDIDRRCRTTHEAALQTASSSRSGL